MRSRPPRRRQPTSTRPGGRVLDRVGDEVLQQPAAAAGGRSAPRASTARTSSSSPFSRASGANSTSSWRSSSSMRKSTNLGLHRAGIEPRNVEQRAEDLLDRLERGVDLPTSSRILAAALALDQAGDVEPRGIERLQDVVAGGGEEPGLGDVGLVGFGLGAAELGVEPRQLLGALAHAALERLVGALQRLGRLHARRDVGEGGDDAAVGHAVGAHLDHQAALGEALEERLAVGDIARDALARRALSMSPAPACRCARR